MRTFRQSVSGISIVVFSLLLISSAMPVFATESSLTVEFSSTPEKSVKGIGWALSSKFTLLKSHFLTGENKIDYLLDVSKQYVDEIEKDTYAGNMDNVQKANEAYANTLHLIENALEGASSEARIETEQVLRIQSQRLEYLSDAVELAKGKSELSVEESKDQSQHLLKELAKEKRKTAILKARETNKTDEEIENETITEENEVSQNFAVRASQFITQAEHAIEKAEQKEEKKNVSHSLLQDARESLSKAQAAYEDEQYLIAIQHAFEAKHAALKFQVSANIVVETDAENATTAPPPLKKVTVKKKELTTEKMNEDVSSQDSKNLITGKVIEGLGHGGDKESVQTSGSADDTPFGASGKEVSPAETPKLKENKGKDEKNQEDKNE